MRDPYFERAVVLLCQHNDDGALGLVINKDGPVPIGAVLRSMSMSRGSENDAPTWWGGPVGPSTGFVIWRGQVHSDEGWTLAGEIAVSPSVDRLTRLVDEGTPFHLCLGYSGWSPEQLEDEIAHGSWLYASAAPLRPSARPAGPAPRAGLDAADKRMIRDSAARAMVPT